MSNILTRRHFLALSTAAAAVVPHAVASQGRRGTLRVGIIGMGGRGAELARAIHDRSAEQDCRIAVVCDRDMERCAPYTPGVSDWREVIARRDVDAVVIATPDHLHAPMAIAAMEAGKDAFCETPLVRTVEEASALRRVAATTGRVLGIGASEPRAGVWRAVRSYVAQGHLGEVYWCQSSISPASAAGGASWRDAWETSAGLATSDGFDRLAGMLCGLELGIPDRVTVVGGTFTGDARPIPDSFVASFEYEGGPRLVLTTAAAHGNGSPTVIRGSRGTLHVGATTLAVETEQGVLRDLGSFDGPTDAVEAWLAALGNRNSDGFDVDAAYPVVVAAGMANAAYRTARTVSFDAESEDIVPARPRLELA